MSLLIFPQIMKISKPMLTYINNVVKMGADGIIISDPGIIYAVKNKIPNLYTILSTQANTTNYESLLFWKKKRY